MKRAIGLMLLLAFGRVANVHGQAPPHAGVKPDEAPKVMTLPPDFHVTLFAGEPDVVQPIAFAIDDRGRLWVAEAMTYPRRAPEGQGKDRIVIFEDTDGDGHFDVRTVFIEGLNLVSGLEVGFGGVWVGAAPYFMFIPDKNGDDKPDGPPQILLDGWHYEDTHETLNAFNWGPDGWLYGCHGVFTHSRVGKPGTPDSQRVPLNAAVWRYHPTRQVFEVFAEGASNQWGVDFNDQGQAFITACVIPHLYHVIQGAHYFRQAGKHFNPYVYRDITTIADHVHWVGDKGPHAANGRSDSAGGGHAHAGAMIYLGDNFPPSYRNSLFMANIHGNRVNNDLLERQGSGYVGKHGRDLLVANDSWARFINLKYGPDGGVYLIDWYDKEPCHLGSAPDRIERWDRSNGRIYKITYQTTKPAPVNLAALSDSDLIKLQNHPNDWYVRHARRILQERGPNPAVQQELTRILADNPDPSRQLRAMWALNAIGSLGESLALGLLDSKDEYVRAWAIQLLCEGKNPPAQAMQKFASLAAEDRSAVVRLYLAAALQRLDNARRWDVIERLVTHAEDVSDHNLPLMYWWALEPAVGQDHARALSLLPKVKIPLLREFITKRIAAP